MGLSTALKHQLRTALTKIGLANELAAAIDRTNGTSVNGDTASGTNAAGSDFNVNGGLGTGNAKNGDVVLRTGSGTAGGSGSTANTALVSRFKGVAKRYPLVTTVAKQLFTFPLAVKGMAGYSVMYTVRCSDGTDMQTLQGRVLIAAANKAGTLTVQFTDTSRLAETAGTSTLTLAWSGALAANVVTISVAATTSLTATTFDIQFCIVNNSELETTDK